MTTAEKTVSAKPDLNGGSQQRAQPSTTNGAAIDLFTKSWLTYAEALSAMSNEIFDFVSQRLEEDANFSKALAECDSPGDIASLHQDWVVRATKQYAEEPSKLLRACLASVS